MNGASASPFSPKAVLGLVLFGALVFVALLWMLGSGMTSGNTNDGGGHVGGKGLNGYAALADLLEKRGVKVSRTRNEAALDDPGLLVLTPPLAADGDKIGEIIAKHRYIGPTLLVLPKWPAMAVPAALQKGKAQKGWVQLGDATTPAWGAELKNVGVMDVRVEALSDSDAHWAGLSYQGRLAAPKAVQTAAIGNFLVPLVRDGRGHALVGYRNDAGYYPDLAYQAGVDLGEGEDEDIFPLIIVAEPDLLNNYGMADRNRALLALEIFRLASAGRKQAVSFDLTLNGFARNANLLTLAFTPPFLAATLCLLMAALAVGWRAFLRFGPPRQGGRAIAFGKRALVSNAAGLIRRTGRLHLVGPPYADHARERIARALSLPRMADTAATDAAIDRALANRKINGSQLDGRKPDSPPFSVIAARLRSARRPRDILGAAQDLHSLERTLIR